MAGDLGIAAAGGGRRGHRRDRRADEAALPARRREDELLELGPAVRLGGDARAVRMGERVDGDPVAGLAGGAAEELPGPLRVRSASVRSSRPKANQRGSRWSSRKSRSATNSSGVGPDLAGARRGSRARRRPGAASGRRRPGRCPGRRAAARRGTPGRRGAAGRRSRAAANASGSSTSLGQARAEGLGRRLVLGDERDGPGGDRAAWSRPRSRRAAVIGVAVGAWSRRALTSGRTRLGRSASSEPERRSVAWSSRLRSSRRRPRRCPSAVASDVAGLGVDDRARRSSTIRRRERGDPALGADRPSDRDRALELDVHARRDAPVVLGDQRPGHDLVEDRADDPAVGDAVPALEAAVERRARSRTAPAPGGGRAGGRAR